MTTITFSYIYDRLISGFYSYSINSINNVNEKISINSRTLKNIEPTILIERMFLYNFKKLYIQVHEKEYNEKRVHNRILLTLDIFTKNKRVYISNITVLSEYDSNTIKIKINNYSKTFTDTKFQYNSLEEETKKINTMNSRLPLKINELGFNYYNYFNQPNYTEISSNDKFLNSNFNYEQKMLLKFSLLLYGTYIKEIIMESYIKDLPEKLNKLSKTIFNYNQYIKSNYKHLLPFIKKTTSSIIYEDKDDRNIIIKTKLDTISNSGKFINIKNIKDTFNKFEKIFNIANTDKFEDNIQFRTLLKTYLDTKSKYNFELKDLGNDKSVVMIYRGTLFYSINTELQLILRFKKSYENDFQFINLINNLIYSEELQLQLEKNIISG